MAVNLSPFGGVGQQFFDNDGNVLSGGKIYTYIAGSTTPESTYTTNVGNIAHANPIILDSAGRVPTGEIWLTSGVSYKFVLKNSNDVLIATYDNIIGINSGVIAETISVFDFMTQAEIANVQSGLGTINVTSAIQAAMDYCSSLTVGDFTGSTGYIGYTVPQLNFPSGVYLCGLVTPNKRFRAVGEGTVVIKSLTGTQVAPAGNWMDAWVVDGYLEGFTFLYFSNAVAWHTNNVDHSFHTLKRIGASYCTCVFDQVSFALSRSTTTELDRWVISSGVQQYARIYSDKSIISNSWFYHDLNTYHAYINSYCLYINNVNVPTLEDGSSSSKASIYFESADEARSLTIDTCRFGAEAGQSPIVVVGPVNPNSVATQYVNMGVDIRNSQLPANGNFDPSGYGAVRAAVVLLDTPGKINTINYVRFESCYGGPDLNNGVIQHYGVLPLSAFIPDDFVIEVDQASAASFTRGINKVCPANFTPYLSMPILRSRTQKISLGSGKYTPLTTGTVGMFKVSFTADLKYPSSNVTPIMLEVILIGLGDTSHPSTSGIYSAMSRYIFTVNGIYNGSAQANIATTLLNSVSGGISSSTNANIVSAHFGTGDSGSSTYVLSGSTGGNENVEMSITFGTNLESAAAYVRPLYDFSLNT